MRAVTVTTWRTVCSSTWHRAICRRRRLPWMMMTRHRRVSSGRRTLAVTTLFMTAAVPSVTWRMLALCCRPTCSPTVLTYRRVALINRTRVVLIVPVILVSRICQPVLKVTFNKIMSILHAKWSDMEYLGCTGRLTGGTFSLPLWTTNQGKIRKRTKN